MPRKKPEELKSGGSTQAPARQSVVLEPAQEISAPVIPSQPQPSAPAPSLMLMEMVSLAQRSLQWS